MFLFLTQGELLKKPMLFPENSFYERFKWFKASMSGPKPVLQNLEHDQYVNVKLTSILT